MIYTKAIEKINYGDVVEFCNEKKRENMYLEYKEDISDNNIKKTIAAMANTWGGHIIIGVEEEDSKPKLPVLGMPYRERLREQVNDIVLGNITPPLLLEVQVCPSEDGKLVFVVIRVPQSDLSPHAIENNTRVYIRTDTSNKPEELANVDRVLWLVDKRRRAVELKESFYARADERFNNLCVREQSIIEKSDVFWGFCPLFPFNVLVDYKRLLRDIFNKVNVSGWGMYMPRRTGEFLPTRDGAYVFTSKKESRRCLYEEINQYGFLYYREELGYAKENDKGITIAYFTPWHELLTRTDLLLESASRLFTEIGYWGLIEISISLTKLYGVTFSDYPEGYGGDYRLLNNETNPIDKEIAITKVFSYDEINTNRASIVPELVSDVCWALGFSNITVEVIELLMKKNDRMK